MPFARVTGCCGALQNQLQKATKNITELSNLGCLPNDFDGLSRFDEGGGLAEMFFQRRARWHLCGYGKFNSTKVERARKQRAASDKHPAGGKYTRSSLPFTSSRSNVRVENSAPTCFICNDVLYGASIDMQSDATGKTDSVELERHLW